MPSGQTAWLVGPWAPACVACDRPCPSLRRGRGDSCLTFEYEDTCASPCLGPCADWPIGPTRGLPPGPQPGPQREPQRGLQRGPPGGPQPGAQRRSRRDTGHSLGRDAGHSPGRNVGHAATRATAWATGDLTNGWGSPRHVPAVEGTRFGTALGLHCGQVL